MEVAPQAGKGVSLGVALDLGGLKELWGAGGGNKAECAVGKAGG